MPKRAHGQRTRIQLKNVFMPNDVPSVYHLGWVELSQEDFAVRQVQHYMNGNYVATSVVKISHNALREWTIREQMVHAVQQADTFLQRNHEIQSGHHVRIYITAATECGCVLPGIFETLAFIREEVDIWNNP